MKLGCPRNTKSYVVNRFETLLGMDPSGETIRTPLPKEIVEMHAHAVDASTIVPMLLNRSRTKWRFFGSMNNSVSIEPRLFARVSTHTSCPTRAISMAQFQTTPGSDPLWGSQA
jgi:hypothetical protein